MRRLCGLGTCLVVLCGCPSPSGKLGGTTGDPTETAALPPPGGTWTRSRQPVNSLIAPAAHLDADAQLAFYSGFSFFRSPWVAAPASTTARDGLGPLFNAHSCDSCHRNGGRGKPLLDDPNSLATVVRLSVRREPDGRTEPHPRFGTQLQTKATFTGGAEAAILMRAVDAGRSLRRGELEVKTTPAESQADWLLSARVAPPLIGMGLLAAIADEDLLRQADAADADSDGISGRPHWRPGDAKRRIGRFGWKALHPTVAEQTGAAFRDDIGITNPLFPATPCRDLQAECRRQPDGNDEAGLEIPAPLFDLVVGFVSHIPPPKAGTATAAVREGRTVFADIGCGSCHVPGYDTEFGRIWPYTDLLLHDMGEALADHRPEGEATGREWRTPPLWGLGTMAKVVGHRTLLHDGRARNPDEAIRWHGGEAAAAQRRYGALEHPQRKALLAFLNAI